MMKRYFLMLFVVLGLSLVGCNNDDSSSAPVSSVSLDQTDLILYATGTESEATLVATVLPGNAANQQVSWSSEDPSVATVDQTGKVKAVADGQTRIVVTTVEGEYTASCAVIVVSDEEEFTKRVLRKAFSQMGASEQTLSEWGWTMENPIQNWEGCQLKYTVYREVNRASCNLTGPISRELLRDLELTKLDLSGNQLSGEIPAEMGNLTSLLELYLNNNQLSGELPVELGNLISLQKLDVTGNRLTGSVPEALKESANYYLFFFNPQQDGYGITEIDQSERERDKSNLLAIKDAWGDNAPDGVKKTWVEENSIEQFSGVEVNGYGEVVSLDFFMLSSSETQSLPDLSVLKKVENLNLSSADFGGALPDWLGNMTSLKWLDISNCETSGDFSPAILKLTNLNILRAEGAGFSGQIPAEIGKMTNLWELDLEYNQFSGPIPAELANLKNLRSLYLSDNQLSGEIPVELCSMTGLGELLLNNNQLSGSIPSEFGNMPDLIMLYLDHNNLSGMVPDAVLNHRHFDKWMLTPQNDGYGFDNYSGK